MKHLPDSTGYVAEHYVGASAAARSLDISVRCLQQLRDRGELPVIRTPLGGLHRRADLERLAAERSARALGHAEGSHPCRHALVSRERTAAWSGLWRRILADIAGRELGPGMQRHGAAHG